MYYTVAGTSTEDLDPRDPLEFSAVLTPAKPIDALGTHPLAHRVSGSETRLCDSTQRGLRAVDHQVKDRRVAWTGCLYDQRAIVTRQRQMDSMSQQQYLTP